MSLLQAEPRKERGLAGRCVAVPESRELDLLAGLLDRNDAQVLRCPLVAIVDAPDPGPVLAWIEAFNDDACDDLILFTGEGLRRLLSCIERHAPRLRKDFVARLGQVRCIARGPKPARELRELGLKPERIVTPATTAGILASLRDEDLHGRRVGVQLYGDDPNRPLMNFLHAAGATALPVAPYAYAGAGQDARVLDLIVSLSSGTVDAIAFTSSTQVDRLFQVATNAEQEEALRAGLRRCVLAAVGPVAAAALARHGLKADVQPERYALKPLVRALGRTLSRSGRAHG